MNKYLRNTLVALLVILLANCVGGVVRTALKRQAEPEAAGWNPRMPPGAECGIVALAYERSTEGQRICDRLFPRT